ncbi:MAG: type II toxin-antitoxin system VapC family toxin [Gallionellaceae bacterium]
MIAVDTNILARLLLRDDEAQYRKAVRLFGDGRDYTAPPTVILELVWVLSSYEFEHEKIASSLTALLGLPNFKPKRKAEMMAAINLYEAGLDFSDAFHLALSDGDDALSTFDDRFAKRAERLGVIPPVPLL